ncbi:MAG: division/cell wall cluster transcriptional repressor MraZ [Bacillota bacterium]
MVSVAAFVGEYLHTIDSKGRLALPAKFRDLLGPRFFIVRGLDTCLFVYPSEEWAKVVQNIKEMPLNQRDSRAYARYFLSGATEVEPDKQGRIVLPGHLREYAGLTKDVYILGVGSRAEIWNKSEWDELKAEIGQSFSKIAESVAGV